MVVDDDYDEDKNCIDDKLVNTFTPDKTSNVKVS